VDPSALFEIGPAAQRHAQPAKAGSRHFSAVPFLELPCRLIGCAQRGLLGLAIERAFQFGEGGARAAQRGDHFSGFLR
jgi:hypothetical protein